MEDTTQQIPIGISEMCEEAGENNSSLGSRLENCDYFADLISNIRLSNIIKVHLLYHLLKFRPDRP